MSKKKSRAEAIVHITTRRPGWGEPDMNEVIGASRGNRADQVIVARKLTTPAKARALEAHASPHFRPKFLEQQKNLVGCVAF
jgi:hypothetical protein